MTAQVRWRSPVQLHHPQREFELPAERTGVLEALLADAPLPAEGGDRKLHAPMLMTCMACGRPELCHNRGHLAAKMAAKTEKHPRDVAPATRQEATGLERLSRL